MRSPVPDVTPSTAKLLRSKKVLIVGTARDCGETIKTECLRLLNATRVFGHASFLIIESDSEDDTLDVLKGLEREIDNFRAISLGKLSEKLPRRTERLARCRNEYLRELESNPEYEKIDYVLMADLDGVNSLIDAEALLSCWGRGDWDVCTANQLGSYYDLWALRHEEWCPRDCWDEYRSFAMTMDRGIAKRRAIFSRMIKLRKGTDWIEVDSAFGGLAVYRRMILKGVRYVGIEADGKAVCEHVHLHRQIISKGYRIFINPDLINSRHSHLAAAVLDSFVRPLFRSGKNLVVRLFR